MMDKGTSYESLKKTQDDQTTYSVSESSKDFSHEKDSDSEGKQPRGHKYHGYATLISVAFAFLLVFVGYSGTEALQTHINSEKGLGTTTVAIVYGTFFLSCFGFGPTIVGHFGSKWPVVLAWTFYALFVTANFYPRTWTLYPTAAAIGFAGGPVWISMGVYTTSLGLEHAAINKKPTQKVLSFFNGIFIGILFFQYPSSALISSIVFFVADIRQKDSPEPIANSTVWPVGNNSFTQWLSNKTQNELDLPTKSVCGARYCSYLTSHISEIHKPDDVFIYINLAIFVTCVVLGMAILSCQRSVRPPDHEFMKVSTRLLKLLQLLKDWRWLLLSPTFALCGVMQGMAINTFSQAFVNCTLNIRWVAYVLTLRGLTCMTTSFVSGKLAQWIPQGVLLMVSYLLELGVLFVWLLWEPTESMAWFFFIVQGVEGIGSGSIRVHATALLGYLFPSDQEVAFAHLNMVVALGNCIIMALANCLCFGAQVYIALGVLAASVIGFILLQVGLRRKRQHFIKVNQASQLQATELKG